MVQIEKKEVLQMAAIIISGMLSNPIAAPMISDQYQRQNLIQQVMWDTINAVMNTGTVINE